MADIFSSRALSYEVTIRARFGTTVCALVTNGLGIAVIDEFTLAGDNWPGVRTIEIGEGTLFETYVAYRKDASFRAIAAISCRACAATWSAWRTQRVAAINRPSRAGGVGKK